jgi:hypothetical protein
MLHDMGQVVQYAQARNLVTGFEFFRGGRKFRVL